jgi:predicted phosphodiesterase
VLVISDIHGNAEAFRAVISDAENYDDVVVLGDLVDYGPDPGKVIDEVKSLGARVVRGNHDEAVVKGIDCRAGPSLHEVSVYTREKITLPQLSKADIAWLGSLPYEIRLDLGFSEVIAAHASLKDKLFKYLYPWLGDEVMKEYLPLPRGVALVGHTHYQFLRPTSFGIKIANPGSVGQPRDGDWRAAYMLISEDGISFRRVKYDVQAVLRKLKVLIDVGRYYEALANILLTGK